MCKDVHTEDDIHVTDVLEFYDPNPNKLNSQCGKYNAIGRGGMGVVHKCLNPDNATFQAVKVCAERRTAEVEADNIRRIREAGDDEILIVPLR